MNISPQDVTHLRTAVQLAKEAQTKGNLPIGAIIVLDGQIVGAGQNSIWQPRFQPNRHAEIEALEKVPHHLWKRSPDMTLYTTLEPCIMCLGAILVHRIGRVLYGAADPHGGSSCVIGHMPYAFERLWQFSQWIGPALPEECDALSATVVELVKARKPIQDA